MFSVRSTDVIESVARGLQRRLRPVAPELMAQGTWAWKRYRGERLLKVVDALVAPGDAVADIGANWGLYTARLAHLVGPNGQVYAFEPHPAHARTLQSLARRRPHIAFHPVALSDAAGTAQLHVPLVGNRPVTALGSLEAGAAAADREIVTVRVDRLDDVLAGRRPPSLVKCDVEGLELRVLRGGELTLRHHTPVLLVEIEQRHPGARVVETFEYLTGLAYAGYFLDRTGPRPLAEFDLERHQLAHLDPGTGVDPAPGGYVVDFLFVDPAFDVAGLVEPLGA